MANYSFPLGAINVGGTQKAITYYICDTDASKPVTGLNVGDLCWAVNTGLLYVATSATTWARMARSDISNWFTQTPGFDSGIYFGNEDSTNVLGTLGAEYTGLAARLWTLPNVRGRIICGGNDADPPLVAGMMGKVNRTAQAAAVASTNLTNATPAGLYRISYYLRCTTASGSATISVSFTGTDDVGATVDTSATISLASTANRVQGSYVKYLASGNITYLTTAVGTIGSGRYQLRVRCEYLG